MSFDGKAMAAEVVRQVREFVGKSLTPINERLDGIEKRIGEMPAGLKGERGTDGKDGVDGKDGGVGEKGINGKDGRDGRDGLPGLPGAPGENGVDGVNGKDGFGLEDFDVTLGEDGRTFSFKFIRGEVCIERQIKVATVMDTGVYRNGTTYAKGDGATWDGSFWIAQADTQDKPGISSAWRLAVKRGQNGKDGKNGERGLPGPDGRAGKDLTQLGFDGRKY